MALVHSSNLPERVADVIVVGAGNAALCAAIAAREAGASVLVLEKAEEGERGGNTFFTGGGYRFPYNGLDDIRALIPDLSDEEVDRIDVGSYPASKFKDDLVRVTEGRADETMVDYLIEHSYPTVQWMSRVAGQRWVLMYGRQAYEVDGKLRFWGGMITEGVGGGEGISESLFAQLPKHGIDVRYGAGGRDLLQDETGRIVGVRIFDSTGFHDLGAGAVVLGCGGFEANPEMRTRYLGAGWEVAKVRGTRHNTGEMLRAALEVGAQSYGHWSGAHAVAWDMMAPPTGNRRIGDLYQKHSYPLGVIVNAKGERFVDEGADLRNYTYAKYGREILKQPYAIAFQIFDQQTVHRLRDEYRIKEATKAEAMTLPDLADQLGIDIGGFVRTIEAYNNACGEGDYDPSKLDGVSTRGIDPPKSNWALPLSQPPYIGFAVTCGITFTFGGVRILANSAQVLDTTDTPMPGLYACGEIVGGLFWHNYPGGTGLMAGAVFGRTAGAAAAKAVGAR
ncbi:MAG: FAD-dependent tricarballylate dehydrogenase TcuA [Chloroflexi bacterium]|nr:FAD-dependent tricarballylate dehydrogenase TcuA [Chloroflexota bacterium]MDA1240651.1 FAD-dependent tricarballylate dehydrogenase TcuA [Chloroflexota bacterium]MQC19261.1 FAD-dependent tricarballylate dehydrogenase TcuA [Chloroflexota bacterium]